MRGDQIRQEHLRRMENVAVRANTQPQRCWGCGHPQRAHERLHGQCIVSLNDGLCPCDKFKTPDQPDRAGR